MRKLRNYYERRSEGGGVEKFTTAESRSLRKKGTFKQGSQKGKCPSNPSRLLRNGRLTRVFNEFIEGGRPDR